MSDIKVSIITVSYNSSATIERTIKSVLSQTYKNIEYLIIDGASTDSTIDIANRYTEAFEGRLKVVSEPDEGIYDAMNKGIRMSSGDLIGIINSDDWYEDDAVEKMVNHFREDEYLILYGMMNTWNKDKLHSIVWNSHEFLDAEMIAHPSCFIAKKLYDDLGLYDTRFKSVADYDFMLRMRDDKRVKFVPVFEIISNFSLGGMCASDRAWRELVELQHERNLISDKQYKTIKFKDRVSRMLHGSK